MKNEMNMTYFEYHNAHHQTHALRMYGVSYDTLGLLGQMDVDDAVASEWMSIPFIDRKDLRK